MNKKISEIEFEFALMLFLGSFWIYLLNIILELSENNHLNHLAFAYSTLHYIVFLLFTASATCFYFSGLSYIGERKKSKIHITLNRLLLRYWPLAFLTGFLLIFPYKFQSEILFYTTLLNISLLLLISILWRPIKTYGIKNNFKYLASFILDEIIVLLILIALYFPYLAVMSSFVGDIQLTSDKSIYTFNDRAVISFNRIGYIFLPEIKDISFNDKKVYFRGWRAGMGFKNQIYNLSEMNLNPDENYFKINVKINKFLPPLTKTIFITVVTEEKKTNK